jgi:hypothetical protein
MGERRGPTYGAGCKWGKLFKLDVTYLSTSRQIPPREIFKFMLRGSAVRRSLDPFRRPFGCFLRGCCR